MRSNKYLFVQKHPNVTVVVNYLKKKKKKNYKFKTYEWTDEIKKIMIDEEINNFKGYNIFMNIPSPDKFSNISKPEIYKYVLKKVNINKQFKYYMNDINDMVEFKIIQI